MSCQSGASTSGYVFLSSSAGAHRWLLVLDALRKLPRAGIRPDLSTGTSLTGEHPFTYNDHVVVRREN